jgi:2-polyprenyl-3-methyl-5-hydroxy-6-metoxy-1,4-benzoquinol methylase
MKDQQSRANDTYGKLALQQADSTVISGRPLSTKGCEPLILKDIFSKLEIKKESKILDIGCGCGELTHLLINQSHELDHNLTLIDIPQVIEKLKKEINQDLLVNLNFIEGNFPDDLKQSVDKDYDKILIYSVLHYVNNPEDFIYKATSCLKPGGSLLVADIPNINRKGRFLSSHHGRSFEANYRGTSINEIPSFKNQFDYISKVENTNKMLTDDLIINIFKKLRSKNFEVYILPQQEDLPFSQTREDLLIKKNFE